MSLRTGRHRGLGAPHRRGRRVLVQLRRQANRVSYEQESAHGNKCGHADGEQSPKKMNLRGAGGSRAFVPVPLLFATCLWQGLPPRSSFEPDRLQQHVPKKCWR